MPFNSSTTSRSIPFDIAGIFMVHIDPTFLKGFRTHYPAYGQVRNLTTFTQHKILIDMLHELFKAEMDASNILEIVSADQWGGGAILSETIHHSNIPQHC
jgi:hypothetical protein